jgi:hypothetical protein
MQWPDVYAFGKPFGPVHRWFAWRPVRLWYGEWAWLRPVMRARVGKYGHLPGPDYEFWTYDAERRDV